MNAALLFEAEPMVHPNVLEAYEKAIRVKRLRLPLDFATRLAPEVRTAYRRVCVKPEG